MDSIIKELYQVAKEYLSESYKTPDDYTEQQIEDALSVIEFIEDGEYEKAKQVGLIY